MTDVIGRISNQNAYILHNLFIAKEPELGLVGDLEKMKAKCGGRESELSQLRDIMKAAQNFTSAIEAALVTSIQEALAAANASIVKLWFVVRIIWYQVSYNSQRTNARHVEVSEDYSGANPLHRSENFAW